MSNLRLYSMKKFRLFFLGLWISFISHAQQYANAFLNIGIDAASMATGGNAVSVIDNVNAVYWNPAGLLSVEHSELALMHSAYFGNLAQVDWAAYAQKRDEKTVYGVGLLRFGVDNIMNTTELIDENGYPDYSRITYFSVADYALMFSYARNDLFVRGLRSGFTAKTIYRHIGNFADGFGFGLDAGLQYSYKKWHFGLTLKDITTTITTWSFNHEALEKIKDAVPGKNLAEPSKTEISLPHMQFGVSRSFTIKRDYHLTASLDFRAWFAARSALIISDYFSLEPGLGISGSYKNSVFLRLGARDFYQTVSYDQTYWHWRPSAGLGIKLKYLSLDYAFTGFDSASLNTHVFSFVLDLRIFNSF